MKYVMTSRMQKTEFNRNSTAEIILLNLLLAYKMTMIYNKSIDNYLLDC